MRALAMIALFLVASCDTRSRADPGGLAYPDAATSCVMPPVSADVVTSPGSTSLLATGPSAADHILIDESNVYWLSSGMAGPSSEQAAAVLTVPKSGGAAVTLFSTTSRISRMAMDSTHIYLAHHDYARQTEPGVDAILRVPKMGGPAETVVAGLNWAWTVAVDESSVYFTDLSGSASSYPEPWLSAIRRAPKSGGTATTLVQELHNPWSLAADETTLYYSEMNAGRIMKLPKSGGVAVELSSGWTATGTLALDTTTVYFSACAADPCSWEQIVAVSKCGGAVAQILEHDASSTIVVGRNHVFWAGGMPSGAASAGMVLRNGQAPVNLLSGAVVTALAAESDESAVYWVDLQTGEVGRTELR